MSLPAAPLRHEQPRRRWLRSVAALDPGLAQLRTANRTACSITLALVAEWIFVEGTHALQVPTPEHAAPAIVAAAASQHHDMLVVAMLLGGLVANLQGINGNELALRSQLVTLAYIGAAVSASLALGLVLGPRRDLALVVMVVLLVIGSAGRRFGQRGAVTGLLLFLGYFYGFFLSSALGPSAAGWLAAEVAIATAAAVAVRLAFFRPSPSRDLQLAMASYDGRARIVLDLSARAAAAPDPRVRRRLQRWLVRLGEAALIVDGQLARGAVSQEAADDVNRRVFDAEVALAGLARFAELLASSELPPDRRNELRQALVDLAAGNLHSARERAREIRAGADRQAPLADQDAVTHWVLRHRFANAVEDMADALDRWPSAPAGPSSRPGGRGVGAAAPVFNPAVTLRGGLLPGSADVSVEASGLPGAGVRIAPYVRTAAQMAVAVTVAIVAGDALDAQRFYWAVVAALLVLVGTNTVAEQLRKAAYRIAGTLAGIVIGTALVNARRPSQCVVARHRRGGDVGGRRLPARQLRGAGHGRHDLAVAGLPLVGRVLERPAVGAPGRDRGGRRRGHADGAGGRSAAHPPRPRRRACRTGGVGGGLGDGRRRRPRRDRSCERWRGGGRRRSPGDRPQR